MKTPHAPELGDIIAATPTEMPPMPENHARNTLLSLGRGGFCHVRPCYWAEFRAAADKLNIPIGQRMTLHNDVWVYRIRRL